MSLKEKLDKHRAAMPSRFTEEQRQVMGHFKETVAAAVRRVPKVGDLLPPPSDEGGGEGPKGIQAAGAGLFQGRVVRVLRPAVAGL